MSVCDRMDCSMSGFPVLHYLPEFAQTHVHGVSDAIQLCVFVRYVYFPTIKTQKTDLGIK